MMKYYLQLSGLDRHLIKIILILQVVIIALIISLRWRPIDIHFDESTVEETTDGR